MSDLHELVPSSHLHVVSDSESDTTSDDTINNDENTNAKMSEKGERIGRQTLSLRNTTIETPSSFDPILDTRIASSVLNSKGELNQGGNGSSVFGNQQTFNRSVSFNLQQERAARADNLSPGPSPQRKLPIPNTAANSNSYLKGILIKPKRILPAQPDSMKLKRPSQETELQCKASANSDDKTNHSFGNSPDADDSYNLPEDPDLHVKPCVATAIDVDRLKLNFRKQELNTTHNSAQPSHRKALDLINVDTDETQQQQPQRSQSECRNVPQSYLLRNKNIYDVGFSTVHEWCSPADENSVKMSSDSSVRNLERGIRSPSPKSNATWDRSSSGYSSDERADPRSPPPLSSAGTSSKHSLESADEERDLKPQVAQHQDELNKDVVDVTKETCDLCLSDPKTQINETPCEREAPSPDVCSQLIVEGTPSARRLPVLDPGKCGCDTNSPRNISSQIHYPISSELTFNNRQQALRRPAWMTSFVNPSQNGGRIQYRKSGSESMISLRHPSRQGLVENTHGGLEVCGVSYKQATGAVPISPRNDGSSDIDTHMDARPDSSTASSTYSDSFVWGHGGPERGSETPNSDVGVHDSSAKARIIRQQFATMRSPRDMKSLNMNVNLNLPKDDNDIRKSLHNLNSPTRRSTGAKTLPIRARHAIHVTNNNQPISDVVTPTQKLSDNESNSGIKHFSKKMWRAPCGQPEGAEPIRPFSPFGGTLPPSKIKENEKRKQVLEVLV